MKQLFATILGAISAAFATGRRVAARACLWLLGLAVLAISSGNALAIDIVSYDDTTDTVTFSPEELVTPLIAAIVLGFSGMATIYLIFRGVRWLVRLIK